MNDNTTASCAEYPPTTSWHAALGCLAGLLSAITVLGNLTVLITVLTKKALRRKQTGAVIFNLALADFLIGAIVMPLSATLVFTNGAWPYSRTLCRIYISVDIICCSASILTLTVISIDRYLGVTRPLLYTTTVTRKRLVIANVNVWIISLLIQLATFRWKTHDNDHCLWKCHVSLEMNYVFYSTIPSFYLPLSLILALYYRIYRVIKRRQSSLLVRVFENSTARPQSKVANPKTDPYARTMSQSRPSMAMFLPLRVHYGGGAKDESVDMQQELYRKQRKSAKTLGIVVGAFVVCWIPFFIVHPLNTFLPGNIPEVLLDAFTWLGYANSTFNPFIYAATMIPLRAVCASVRSWVESHRPQSGRQYDAYVRSNAYALRTKERSPRNDRSKSSSVMRSKSETSLNLKLYELLIDKRTTNV